MAFVSSACRPGRIIRRAALSRRRSCRVFQNITANPTEYGRFEYGGLPVEPDGGPARNGLRVAVATHTAVLVAVPDNSPLLGLLWRFRSGGLTAPRVQAPNEFGWAAECDTAPKNSHTAASAAPWGHRNTAGAYAISV
jgi:hypothetical protein